MAEDKDKPNIRLTENDTDQTAGGDQVPENAEPSIFDLLGTLIEQSGEGTAAEEEDQEETVEEEAQDQDTLATEANEEAAADEGSKDDIEISEEDEDYEEEFPDDEEEELLEVGEITSAEGRVYAVDEHGKSRKVGVGDKIYYNEKLYTASDGALTLTDSMGTAIDVPSSTSMQLDNCSFNIIPIMTSISQESLLTQIGLNPSGLNSPLVIGTGNNAVDITLNNVNQTDIQTSDVGDQGEFNIIPTNEPPPEPVIIPPPSNAPPSVSENTMTIFEGQTLLLDASNLNAADDGLPSGTLTFTVDSVDNGVF